MKAKALVMGSDGRLVQALASALADAGLDIATAPSLAAFVQTPGSFQPQVVVLDLDGPGQSGTSAEVRSALGCPVLALGGPEQRPATDHRDGHLRKPFGRVELLAAVQRTVAASPNGAPKPTSIQIGDVTVDVSARIATVGTLRLQLTRKEFQLLAYLVEHAGMAVPRGEAFQTVWGYDIEYASNSLEVTMYRLRKKLEDAGAAAEVQTIRGYGYRLLA